MGQGYLIYSVRQKLKQDYAGLKGDEIKNLKLSGAEVCLGFSLNLLISPLIYHCSFTWVSFI